MGDCRQEVVTEELRSKLVRHRGVCLLSHILNSRGEPSVHLEALTQSPFAKHAEVRPQ